MTVSHRPIEKPNGVRLAVFDREVAIHESDSYVVRLRDWDADVHCAIAFDATELRLARMKGDGPFLAWVMRQVGGALDSLADRQAGRPGIGGHVEFDGDPGWVVHKVERVGQGLYVVSAHKGGEEIVDVPWERCRYA